MSAQLMSILLTNTSSIHFKSDTIITENESVDRFTERERKSEKKKEKRCTQSMIRFHRLTQFACKMPIYKDHLIYLSQVIYEGVIQRDFGRYFKPAPCARSLSPLETGWPVQPGIFHLPHPWQKPRFREHLTEDAWRVV